MDKETFSKREDFKKTQSNSLDGLDFLATAAGQLNAESQKRSLTPNSSSHSAEYLSMPHFALPNTSLFSPYSQSNLHHYTKAFGTFGPIVSSNKLMTETHHINHSFLSKTSSMKELVESCLTSASCSTSQSQKQNFYVNANLPNLPRMSSASPLPGADLYQQLADSNKSAFKVVQPKTFEETDNGLQGIMPCTVSNVPETPPTLFRMDTPEAKGTYLFETLVQESQKILSGKEKSKERQHSEYSEKKEKMTKKMTGKEDYKMAKNGAQMSPQKKLIRKRKHKNTFISGVDSKRAYGGPPFNPTATPPKPNTTESALCTLHEHTLLKMATRGFWSGDRGPLQDVFRLTRVENSDLQYNISEITEHCYNVVKQKLENVAHGSEELDIMLKHMRCYVDELDSYLERIYPVSSVAINIYLPTAMDYIAATWHGIVPTGWSEYRRAVVIREVFEVLYHLSSMYVTIPPYSKHFFRKKLSDPTLYPSTFAEETKADEPQNKSIENEMNPSDCTIDSSDIKYSRAFEALWTRTAPHEPFLIIDDTTQLKLREYLERYPIETAAPPENAIIVIDDKKYKARQILGYFRRGVQLVDYSKETGSMVIDTISTFRRISITSAVRKIPPGKISKLIHPDLHLENYTNAILQIGSVAPDNLTEAHPAKLRPRKRRIKIGSVSAANKKDVKVEETERLAEEESLIPDVRKLDSIATFCAPLEAKTDSKEDSLLPISHQLTNEIKMLQEPNSREPNPYDRMAADVEIQRRNMATKKYWDSFFSQSNPSLFKSKPEIPCLHTPDILSSMYLPPGPCGDMFSLHLMIDSYRRAAKYLLDTANHLELVAKRGANTSRMKRDQTNENES